MINHCERRKTRKETNKAIKPRQGGYTHKVKIRDETRLNTLEKGNIK